MSSRLLADLQLKMRPAAAFVCTTTLVVGVCATMSITSPAAAAPAGPWGYTPGERTFLPGDGNSSCYNEYEVPEGVTRLGLKVVGDGGVNGNNNKINGTGTPGHYADGTPAGNAGRGQAGGLGGFGSEVNTIIDVTPGQTLYVGAASDAFPGGAGGAAGMGLDQLPDTGAELRAVPGTGGSGGNASFVSLSMPGAGCTFTADQIANDVLVVAAGGGGGGGAGSGQDEIRSGGIIANAGGGDGGSETGSAQAAERGESFPWDIALEDLQVAGQSFSQRDAGGPGTNATGSAAGASGTGGWSISTTPDWVDHGNLYSSRALAALSCIPGQGGGEGQPTGGGSGGSAAQALTTVDADPEHVISSSATNNVVSRISQSLRGTVTKVSRLQAGLPQESFFESEGTIMMLLQILYAAFDHIMAALTGEIPKPTVFLTGCGGLITHPDPGYYALKTGDDGEPSTPVFMNGLTTGGGGGGGGGIFGGGGGGGADDFYLSAGGGGGGAGASYVKGQTYAQTKADVTHATTTPRVRLIPIRSAPTVDVPDTSVVCVVHSECELPVEIGGYPAGRLGYQAGTPAMLPSGITFQQDQIHHSAVGNDIAYDAWSTDAAIGGIPQFCFSVGVHDYTDAFSVNNSEGSATLPPVSIDVRPGTLEATRIEASYGVSLDDLFVGGNPARLNAYADYSSNCDEDVTTSETGAWWITDEKNRAGDPVAPGSVLTTALHANGEDQAVTAMGPGTAVVHFGYTDEWGQEQEAEKTITVARGIPESIAFDDAGVTLEPGEHVTPTVRGDYGLGDIADITDQVQYSGVPSTLNQAGISIEGNEIFAGTPLQVSQPTATDDVTANLAGKSDTLPVTVDFSDPTALSIQGNSAAQGVLQPGSESGALTARATYAAGGQADVTRIVTWSSNRPSVADVDDDGTVAVPYYTVGGTATITATLGSVSKTWQVNVAVGAPDTMAVDDGNGHTGTATVDLGSVVQLHATGTVGDDSVDLTADSTWSTSNAAVATVSAGGLLQVVGRGAATITATRGGVPGTLRVTADAGHPSSITITPTVSTIPLGGTQRFYATGRYPGGITADVSDLVTWSAPSSLGTFATGTNLFQTDYSQATPVTDSVTASLGSASASVTVNKLGSAPLSISVSGPSATLGLGESQQLTVTAHYFDGSTTDVTDQVTWEPQDEGLFTVDRDGEVTAIADSIPGSNSTNIWATFEFTDAGGTVREYEAAKHLTVDISNPVSITVEPITAALVNGSTHDLVATGTYAGGYTADLTFLVVWQTSNTTHTAISGASMRRLTILAPPSASSTTVTATYGGRTRTRDLTLPGAFTSVAGPTTADATILDTLSLDFSIAGGAAPYTWDLNHIDRAGSNIQFSSTHGASTTLTFRPVGADWTATDSVGHTYAISVRVTDAQGRQAVKNVIVQLVRRAQTLTWVQDRPDTALSTDRWSMSATSSSGLSTVLSVPDLPANNGCRIVSGQVRFDTGYSGTCVFQAVQEGDSTYAPATIQKTVTIAWSGGLEYDGYPNTTFLSFNAVNAAEGSVTVVKPSGHPGTILFSTEGTTNNACSITTPTYNQNRANVRVRWDKIGTCKISASIAAASTSSSGYSYEASTTATLTSTVTGWTSGLSWRTRYTAFNSGIQADANLKVGGTYQPVYQSNWENGTTDFFLASHAGNPVNSTTPIEVEVVPEQSSPANACSVDPTRTSGIVVGRLNLDHAGTCAVRARQAQTDRYVAAVSPVKLFTIGKASQTLTNFRNTSAGTPLVPGSTVTVAATASSGLTPTYTVDPTTTNNACSVDGAAVKLLHAGRCVLAADQAGNDDYTAAPTVKLTLDVGGLHLLLRSAVTCTSMQEQRGQCTAATAPPLSGPLSEDPAIPVRVVLLDASNNPVNAPSDITVTLNSDTAGDGSAPKFHDMVHRDVTSVVLSRGTNATTVLYGDSVIGVRNLYASGRQVDPATPTIDAAPTPLTILAGSAESIDWVTAPEADGMAGTPMPSFSVTAHDEDGNATIGAKVTLTATNYDTGEAVDIASGASTRILDDPDTGGLAVFDATVINEPGAYHLTATTEGVSVTSDFVWISTGAASAATFNGVPATAGTGPGHPLDSFTVTIRDAGGNPLPSTLVGLDDGGTGHFHGYETYTDSEGVATFDSVYFDAPGEYTLRAVVADVTLDGASSPITVGTVFEGTEAPALSGDTTPGDTVSTTDGAWAETPTTVTYRWLRCDESGDVCDPISGATSSSYELTEDDLGHTVRSEVTANNGTTTATQRSAPSGVVERAVRPAQVTRPTINGDAVVDGLLVLDVGGWTGNPNQYDVQWVRCATRTTPYDQCVAIPDAISIWYTVTADDAGFVLRASVTAIGRGGRATAFTPPTTTAGAPTSVERPTITGTSTLVLDPGTWTGSPALTYQWLRCAARTTPYDQCVPIGGARGTTYEPGTDDTGTMLRAAVTATNAAGVAIAYTAPTVPMGAPMSVDRPTISGDTVLNLDKGTWTGSPTFAYQWLRCATRTTPYDQCLPIADATGTSYTVTADDSTFVLRAAVTATNATGQAIAYTAPTVTMGAPTSTSRPTISGSSVLTVDPGGWTGGPDHTYQWLRCATRTTPYDQCVAIPDAVGTEYTPTGDDTGSILRVAVTATNGAGQATAYTAPTAMIGTPMSGVRPSISGDTLLTVDPGTWTGSPDLEYQWLRCATRTTPYDQCVAIPDAVDTEYTPTGDDTGSILRVAVTATNAAGQATAYTPPTIVIGAPTRSDRPTITGDVLVDSELTVDPGTWTGNPTYTYQWLRCATRTTPYDECDAIPGESDPAYTLTADDLGSVLRAVVTATNVAGQVTAHTAPTTTVGAPAFTTRPTITGTTTLTVDPGTWDGGPAFTYQWLRCATRTTPYDQCVAIPDAVGTEYTPTGDDTGQVLRVAVVATNGYGSTTGYTAPTGTL